MKIWIRTSNAAFKDGAEGRELARILRDLARRVEVHGGQPRGREEWPIRDVNGNRVGKVTR